MFLSSALIILREILEAALLLSIFLALVQRLRLDSRWLLLALVAGLAMAVVYGANIGIVSDSFDGVGQELFNALLQLIIVMLLLLFVVLVLLVKRVGDGHLVILTASAATALAVTREGSEIYLYLWAFSHNTEQFPVILHGSLLGAGIGFSVGALFYYFLLFIDFERVTVTAASLLTAVAAGMVSQAVNLLIQADLLAAQPPAINLESIVPEASVLGQLLYALIGYESTPGSFQLACYAITLLLFAAVITTGKLVGHTHRHVP